MNKPYTLLLLLALSLCSKAFSQQPKLSSLPVSQYTLYLDFDGHYVVSGSWNGGIPINCAPAGMTTAQITEVFNRVAEDYRPFDINITTDSTVYLATALEKRMRVIVTPTSAWRPGVGGIAWTGSFVWGDDTPCFVFSDRLGPNSPKMVAECCSHESGHTVGLSHQSRYDGSCVMTETYNSGNGGGEIAWAPIMGNSYYRNMSGWNDGPTQYGCSSTQDNLSTMTSQNGFTYRADDYTDAPAAGNTAVNATSFTREGVISTTTDKDAFKFTLSSAAPVHIDAKPFSIGVNNEAANLDIKIQLYNSSFVLVRTYDPSALMSVVIDSTLNAGTYYIVLDGAGNANISDYGSLGSYTLSGFSGALPIREVALSGTSDRGKHSLSWSITADEPVKSVDIEVSSNGITFRSVTSIAGTATKFTYAPFETSNLYYRLKATSVINQAVYSNVISLKGAAKQEKPFTVSTFVSNEVAVNASENYQYRLSDANGKLVAQGTGTKGINKINVYNKPAGLYVIQLVSNNERITERIIKQ